MKLNVRRNQVAAAVMCLSMTVGASGAYAGAVATSYLKITDLTFTKSTGGAIVLGTDVVAAPGGGIDNTGDTLASFTTAGGALISDANPTNQVDAGTGAFDVGTSTFGNDGFSCVGSCSGGGYTDDSFTRLAAGADVPVTGSYVVNDVVQSGSAIEIPTGGGGTLPPATATGLAEAAVNPNLQGTGQGNVGLISSIQVISGFTGDLEFSFNYDAFLRAFLSPELQGQFSRAEFGWTLSIVRDDNGGFGSFNYSLSSDFTGTISNGVDSGATTQTLVSVNQTGRDRFITGAGQASGSTTGDFFVQGGEYTITVSHTNLADASAVLVPAPASLGLMSLGLLTLAGVYRRRARQLG